MLLEFGWYAANVEIGYKMSKMRSANPLGARNIVRTLLPLLVLALALILAGPASSENHQGETNDPPKEDPQGQELVSPPSDDDDNDDDDSASNGANSGSFFLRSAYKQSQAELRFERTQKELSRLFVLSKPEIDVEFPGGGFDRALVQAANRARRAERALNRR